MVKEPSVRARVVSIEVSRMETEWSKEREDESNWGLNKRRVSVRYNRPLILCGTFASFLLQAKLPLISSFSGASPNDFNISLSLSIVGAVIDIVGTFFSSLISCLFVNIPLLLL